MLMMPEWCFFKGSLMCLKICRIFLSCFDQLQSLPINLWNSCGQIWLYQGSLLLKNTQRPEALGLRMRVAVSLQDSWRGTRTMWQGMSALWRGIWTLEMRPMCVCIWVTGASSGLFFYLYFARYVKRRGRKESQSQRGGVGTSHSVSNSPISPLGIILQFLPPAIQVNPGYCCVPSCVICNNNIMLIDTWRSSAIEHVTWEL